MLFGLMPLAASADTTAKATVPYKIVSKTYTQNDEKSNIHVTIKYPQMTGLANTARQSAIDKLLKDAAMQASEGPVNNGVTVQVTYRVMWQGPRVLSVIFDWYWDSDEGEDPSNNITTLNLDVTNGKRIALTQIAHVDTNLESAIKRGVFNMVYPASDVINDPLAYFDTSVDPYISDCFQSGTSNYGDLSFYFTKNGLALAFCTEHPLGEYMTFAARYTSILPYLVRNNAIWQDFSGVYQK